MLTEQLELPTTEKLREAFDGLPIQVSRSFTGCESAVSRRPELN